MSEQAALPIAVVFGVMTVLLVRSRDVKAWEAVIIGLFGMYVGQTAAFLLLNQIVVYILSGFTHHS
ncbi:hypothetical protein LKL35_10000 [Streptomyces sp. ET3-23]|uniref:hypothetical protein n=1 Tax=Streptomyces sp. ET3-23 TaxID=2885643 RepID=UPI001D11EFB8|nr:hypothetical protein [Streptomyces sp. ET3-23]MCC2275749.1 hypothetical protein [Streptomyces sp. ET3-23]